MSESSFVILMAEDDEHDIVAVQRAWRREEIGFPLYIVRDGEECIDYLLRRGRYAAPESSPRPGLLLLDINMPKMDGIEVLRYLRGTKTFKYLPVVMLTTSKLEEDRIRSYETGANAYLCKPVGFQKLSSLLRNTSEFWSTAELPGESNDQN